MRLPSDAMPRFSGFRSRCRSIASEGRSGPEGGVGVPGRGRQTPLPGGPNKAVHCVPGCKSACRWAIAAAKFRACSSSSRYENGRFRMRPEGRISPGRGVHIGGCQRRTHALSTSSTKSVAGRTQVTTVTTGTTVTSKSVACRVPSACKSRSIDTSFNFSNMRKGRGSLPEPNMRTICG